MDYIIVCVRVKVFRRDYYPPELVDWWADDWISHVYGRQRTFVTAPGGAVTVVHYVHKHRRRYRVDFRHEKLLPALVLEGQRTVFEWMLAHKRPLAELNHFRESCVQYGEKDEAGAPRGLLNVARARQNATRTA